MTEKTVESKSVKVKVRDTRKGDMKQAEPVAENVQAAPVEVPAEQVSTEKAAKPREGSEVSLEEVQQVIDAASIEEAIRAQVGDKPVDVEVPYGDLIKLAKLRDNSRQAYKENEVRFKNALNDKVITEQRLAERPDPVLSEFVAELEFALCKYVSKMRKYLKRYDAARAGIAEIRNAEAKAAETSGEQSGN